MVTARNVASYFIDKSSKLDENNDLTNLKLQKILYYTQVEYIKKNSSKLFADDIEAWQYGPVVKDVYNWLKGCGAYTVTSFDVDLSMTTMSSEINKFLDNIWDKYNKYSAWYLVNETHVPKSPWSETYRGGLGDRDAITYDIIAGASTLK